MAEQQNLINISAQLNCKQLIEILQIVQDHNQHLSSHGGESIIHIEEIVPSHTPAQVPNDILTSQFFLRLTLRPQTRYMQEFADMVIRGVISILNLSK